MPQDDDDNHSVDACSNPDAVLTFGGQPFGMTCATYSFDPGPRDMALLANCHRDPKKRAFTPDDFNPTVTRAERADVIRVTPETIGDMREAFDAMASAKGAPR